MVERRRTTTWLTWVAAGLIIGAVESRARDRVRRLRLRRASLVADLPAGIGLYLGAAVLTLGFLAWRAGSARCRGQRAGRAGSRPRGRGHRRGGEGRRPRVHRTDLRLDGLRASRHLPDRRHRDPRRDRPLRDRLRGDREVPAGRADPVRAVSGRRRVPRRHGMAALQGWGQRRDGDAGTAPQPRPVDPRVPARPLAPGPRVRCDPADLGPGREAPARDPGGDRDRARGVRDRDGRHRLLDRGGPRGRVAAVRSVRDGAAVEVPWTFEALGGADWRVRARVVGRDRDRGVRGHARDPVQHQRHRARLGPGPRHEQGAPRRRAS